VFTFFESAAIDGPQQITAGPDGALWFTNAGNNSIGRITTAGVVTSFTGTGISEPIGIATGPDGNLWFTNYANQSIGRITPGGTVTNYPDANILYPIGITSGADGNLWFASHGNDRVGRITPAGTITTFTHPDIHSIDQVTRGPDGNVWFTNFSGGIGRVTPTGTITVFPAVGFNQPEGITTGPDGTLWFTNAGSNDIGRITPIGAVTVFPGAGIHIPQLITTGSDGALWFTNLFGNSIGRVTAISGSYFHPLPPTRILDSRGATGGWGGPLAAGNPKLLTVTGGVNAVPVDADAVVLNVTVTGGSANSFLTAYPAGGAKPNVSNLNFAAGQTTPNLITVKVGANGQVAFANEAGSVHVIADIAGYFDSGPADRFNAVTPTRILDSRGPNGGWNAPLVSGAPRSLQITGVGGVPATADAVILNVTATGSNANSFLTAYPTGGSVPNVSNLNFAAGETIPNLVTVKLGTGGKVSFANAVGSVQVIADVAGYYDTTTGDVFHAVTPARILDSRGPTGGWGSPLVAGTPRTLSVVGAGSIPADATAVIANTTVTGGSANSFLTVYPTGAPLPVASTVNYGAGQTIPNLTAVKLGTSGRLDFATAAGSTDVIFDVAGYFAPT
jgi:streptogramin lyase